MLKIEKKEYYQLTYVNVHPYNISTTPHSIAQKVGLTVKDYVGVHFANNAFIHKSLLVFKEYEDAKKCYLQIAFDEYDKSYDAPSSIFLSEQLMNSLFIVKFRTNYVQEHCELSEMAKRSYLKTAIVLETILKHNGKDVLSDKKYVFEHQQDSIDCANALNDILVSKKVMRKLSK